MDFVTLSSIFWNKAKRLVKMVRVSVREACTMACHSYSWNQYIYLRLWLELNRSNTTKFSKWPQSDFLIQFVGYNRSMLLADFVVRTVPLTTGYSALNSHSDPCKRQEWLPLAFTIPGTYLQNLVKPCSYWRKMDKKSNERNNFITVAPKITSE